MEKGAITVTVGKVGGLLDTREGPSFEGSKSGG